MTSSNVAASLRELEKADLVIKSKQAGDARRALLSISPTGTKLSNKLRSERDSWLGQAINHELDETEQAQLLAAGLLIERLAAFENDSNQNHHQRNGTI